MRELVATLAIASLTAGCIGGSVSGPPRADADTRSRVAAAKRDSRDWVHAVLGEPWIASQRYGVEVFRGKDRDLLAGLIYLRFPITGASLGRRSPSFALIGYDASGLVTSVDTTYPKGGAPRDAALMARAGDIVFYDGPTSEDAARQRLMARAGEIPLYGERRYGLLVVPLARFLENRKRYGAQDQCIVLVGCGEGVCWNRLQVDKGGTQELPLCELGWVPVVLGAGHHRLTFRLGRVAGEARAEVECASGDVLYALVGGDMPEEQPPPQRSWAPGETERDVAGTVEIAREAPARPKLQGVIVNVDGRWLDPDAR